MILNPFMTVDIGSGYISENKSIINLNKNNYNLIVVIFIIYKASSSNAKSSSFIPSSKSEDAPIFFST